MKWESEEHVGIKEAAEWARHFGQLEHDMDNLLARMLGVEPSILADWLRPGRYVSGSEFAAAGMAELIELTSVPQLFAARNPKRARTPRS
jgi:hypothetical protein